MKFKDVISLSCLYNKQSLKKGIKTKICFVLFSVCLITLLFVFFAFYIQTDYNLKHKKEAYIVEFKTTEEYANEFIDKYNVDEVIRNLGVYFQCKNDYGFGRGTFYYYDVIIDDINYRSEVENNNVTDLSFNVIDSEYNDNRIVLKSESKVINKKGNKIFAAGEYFTKPNDIIVTTAFLGKIGVNDYESIINKKISLIYEVNMYSYNVTGDNKTFGLPNEDEDELYMFSNYNICGVVDSATLHVNTNARKNVSDDHREYDFWVQKTDVYDSKYYSSYIVENGNGTYYRNYTLSNEISGYEDYLHAKESNKVFFATLFNTVYYDFDSMTYKFQINNYASTKRFYNYLETQNPNYTSFFTASFESYYDVYPTVRWICISLAFLSVSSFVIYVLSYLLYLHKVFDERKEFINMLKAIGINNKEATCISLIENMIITVRLLLYSFVIAILPSIFAMYKINSELKKVEPTSSYVSNILIDKIKFNYYPLSCLVFLVFIIIFTLVVNLILSIRLNRRRIVDVLNNQFEK